MRPLGLAVLFASAVAVAGCTQFSGPGEEEPPEAEREPVPHVTEHMASLEERGGQSPLAAPVHEVTHYVGQYRPLRSLPVLVSRTPAPHPGKDHAYFMHGHGVETEIRPRLERTTSSDGFQWFISWNPAFAGDHISPITVDLVATLLSVLARNAWFEGAPSGASGRVGMLMIGIGIGIGLVALAAANLQHRRALQALRAQCPGLRESTAGATAALIMALGMIAFVVALL